MRLRAALSLVFIIGLLSCGGRPTDLPFSSHVKHVVLVAFGNQKSIQLIGSPDMPYLNQLARKYGVIQGAFDTGHANVPRYVAVAANENGAGTTDVNYGESNSEQSLVRLLTAAGRTWKAYLQSLPVPGYAGSAAYPYTPAENPFADSDASQAANVVPLSQLNTDLAQQHLPAFSYIAPDGQHNLDGCPPEMLNCGESEKRQAADSWLQVNIAPLIDNSEFRQSGVLIVTLGNRSSIPGPAGVEAIVMSPDRIGPNESVNLPRNTTLRHFIVQELGIDSGISVPAIAVSAVPVPLGQVSTICSDCNIQGKSSAMTTLPANVIAPTQAIDAVSIHGISVAPPVAAGTQLMFNGTSIEWQDKPWCDIRDVSGSDIGSRINACYGSLPPSGGTIYIAQKPDGSCYDFSAPVYFTIIGKPVKLVGVAPGTLGGPKHTSQTGTCLNYIPTANTAAFSVDWGSPDPAPDTSYAGTGGFYNVQLINNQCVTNGGCGSSAVGIRVGAGNGGARGLVLQDTSVMGFGKGVEYAPGDSGGVGWGTQTFRGSFAFNTVGVSYEKRLAENDSYFGVKFIANGIHINIPNGAGAAISIFGGSLDSATTCGISGSAHLELHGVWMENLGTSNVQYTCDPNKGLTLFIAGGQAIDDTEGGSTQQSWFSSSQTYVTGLKVFGGKGGRKYAGKIFNLSDVGYIAVLNSSPSAISANNLCNWTVCYWTNLTAANTFGTGQRLGPIFSIEQNHDGGSDHADALWADSIAHRWKMNNNNLGAVNVVGSGVDINQRDEVVATHLAVPLPKTQGGTGINNSNVTFPDSGTIPTVGSGEANKTVCWKTPTVLGYCSTGSDSSGTCTCK
jgi:hypothetical protein